jgi:hypothetical protein
MTIPEERITEDARLTAALAGRVTLPLGEVLRAAAGALRGSKRWILLGLLTWLSVALVTTLLGLALGLSELLAGSLSVIATAPVALALTMFAVRRVAGVATGLGDLLRYRPAVGHAVAVMLLASLAVSATEALLGPFWSLPVALLYGLATSQALFLTADRGADAFTAIGWSVRACLPLLPALFLLHALLTLVVMLGALLLGIGLLWAAPFAVLALGAVSVRLFGTTAAAAAG